MTTAIVVLMLLSMMQPAAGTFTLASDSAGAIIRMDTRTGQAERCRIVDGVLRCEPVSKTAEAK